MGVLLQICCIFSESLFLGTPVGGCFRKRSWCRKRTQHLIVSKYLQFNCCSYKRDVVIIINADKVFIGWLFVIICVTIVCDNLVTLINL